MPREDETHRNSIGGHTRVCTCVDCSLKRMRSTDNMPSRYPSTSANSDMAETDWQAFTDSIRKLGGSVAQHETAEATFHIGKAEKQGTTATSADEVAVVEVNDPQHTIVTHENVQEHPKQPQATKKSLWQRLLKR